MTHQCTSECGHQKDCPLCPHGKDEDEYCEECGDEKPTCFLCGGRGEIEKTEGFRDDAGVYQVEGTGIMIKCPECNNDNHNEEDDTKEETGA